MACSTTLSTHTDTRAQRLTSDRVSCSSVRREASSPPMASGSSSMQATCWRALHERNVWRMTTTASGLTSLVSSNRSP